MDVRKSAQSRREGYGVKTVQDIIDHYNGGGRGE